MWSLKFSVQNEDSIYTLLTKKCNITDYFYPVDFYREKKKIHILGIHVIEGDAIEKKKFAHLLQKHPKTKRFEQNEHMLIVLMEEEEAFYELIYDPSLYHPAPAVIRNGIEQWHIASWNRTKLQELMQEIERSKKIFSQFHLQSLGKTDLREIYFPKVLPSLPDQQKRAFQIALENGYYTYPRTINLQKLAGEMHISVSTFQEHLRKAEAKLIPFFVPPII